MYNISSMNPEGDGNDGLNIKYNTRNDLNNKKHNGTFLELYHNNKKKPSQKNMYYHHDKIMEIN